MSEQQGVTSDRKGLKEALFTWHKSVHIKSFSLIQLLM